MSNRHDKYLSRVDLVKNQVERQRLKEQEYSAAKRKKLQQQNKLLYERQQLIASAELAARVAASNASGGDESSTDTDAQAFITAASITNPTQQSAINTLVTDLKGYGVWSKMKALYPFVGGTASQHKFNLKNPLDTDAAFRLVFNGGWTHSANGALPNGTNGYADTKLIPSINWTKFNHHFSLYSRTNNKRDVFNGARNSGPQQAEVILLRSTDSPNGKFYYWSYGWGQSSVYIDSTDSTGLFLATNRSASDREVYRNGNSIATNTYDMTPYLAVTFSMWLASNNFNGSANGYDNKEIAFASLGDGLTDTEAANFYTAVQAFQTTLGRNI
jgi:hypothetical protein